jgi:hypothetical protein
MHWAHWSTAWTELVHVTSPHEAGAKRGIQYTLERNFAELELDWDKKQVIVRVLGHNTAAAPLLSTAWDFDQLNGVASSSPPATIPESDYAQSYRRLSTRGAEVADWICVSSHGTPSVAVKLYGVVSPILVVLFLTFLPFNLILAVACIAWRRRNVIRTTRTHSQREKQS